ncbi:MAG TPA: hypothetical protein GXX17_07035 [Clostridiales bacterium]|nr:hypothetical protein [Clostridiales bacterium]
MIYWKNTVGRNFAFIPPLWCMVTAVVAILLLQVEYYHAIETEDGQNSSIILDCIEKYKSNIQQQEALLADPIEKNIVIDTQSDGMYYSENIVFKSKSYDLAGKTKNQVIADMSNLAKPNYGGFNNWENLNYFNAAPLFTGQYNWSEFLINQGGLGKK